MNDSVRRLAQIQKNLYVTSTRKPPFPRYPVNERPPRRPPAPAGVKSINSPPKPPAPKPKPGLTLQQLIDSTEKYFPGSVENAMRDKVTIVNLKKKANVITCDSMTYNGTKSVPEIRKHSQTIIKRAYNKDDPNLGLPFSKAKVLVSCSCDQFKFAFEYALTERNAARIQYSNGEFPVIKNPKLIPGGCKHCWVLWTKIVKAGI